jgi:hypothetical protein
MITQIATLRSAARELVIEQVPGAAHKGHERNYEKLYVHRDGDVRWTECINKSDELIDDQSDSRSIAAIPSVCTVGTGSFSCNCDYCNAVFDQTGEDLAADSARFVDSAAQAEARQKYRNEHSYASETEAVDDAVANSDLEDLEALMLAQFDAIEIGYFDDEA